MIFSYILADEWDFVLSWTSARVCWNDINNRKSNWLTATLYTIGIIRNIFHLSIYHILLNESIRKEKLCWKANCSYDNRWKRTGCSKGKWRRTWDTDRVKTTSRGKSERGQRARELINTSASDYKDLVQSISDSEKLKQEGKKLLKGPLDDATAEKKR